MRTGAFVPAAKDMWFSDCISGQHAPRLFPPPLEAALRFTEDRETKASNTQKTSIRLDLTEDQRARVREALGKEAKAVELTAEPLEERVNPIIAILIG